MYGLFLPLGFQLSFSLRKKKTPLLQSSWLSLPPTNVLLEEQFSNEKLRVLF